MTEVEIVARAICEIRYGDPDRIIRDSAPVVDRKPSTEGGMAPRVLREIEYPNWKRCEVEARRVVAALDQHRTSLGLVTVPEEPTMGMYDDFIAASKASNDKMFAGFEDGYRAMIQAALTTAKKREGS